MMSNTPKHTPGPWIVEDLDDTFICSNDGKLICTIRISNVRNPANYPLIAAAPEMLEALEYLFEKMDEADNFCVKDTGDHLYPNSKFKQIDNIIKKAKGEQ